MLSLGKCLFLFNMKIQGTTFYWFEMAIASFSSTLLFFHRVCCLWLFICYWKMTADLENVITAWLLGKASFFHVHLTPSYITGLAFVWTGSFWQKQILNLTEPSCNMSRACSEHQGLCLPVPVPWAAPSTLPTDPKCTLGLTPPEMQSDFSISHRNLWGRQAWQGSESLHQALEMRWWMWEKRQDLLSLPSGGGARPVVQSDVVWGERSLLIGFG